MTRGPALRLLYCAKGKSLFVMYFSSCAGVIHKGAVGSAAWLRQRQCVSVFWEEALGMCAVCLGRVSCYKLYQHSVTSHVEEL